MAQFNPKSYAYYGGRNSYPRADMDKNSQYDTNMSFIMDSLKVIRNQLAILRIYLPAIFTFCVLTLFLTIFIHHIQAPSSVLIVNEYLGQSDLDKSQNEESHPNSIQQNEQKKPGAQSLEQNFNGYMSYDDVLQNKNYLYSQQACEYGSLWQTSNLLKNNQSVQIADDRTTRTLNIMNISALPYQPNYRSPCFLQHAADRQTLLRCLPYFFLAGFPKCGTTDMYKRMELHPLINGANEKEPLWFSRDHNMFKKLGIKTSFTKYSTKFSQATQETQRKARRVTLTDSEGHAVNQLGYHPLLIGDFSTRELFNERLSWEEDKPMTVHWIRHVMPCTKFIVLMRDPVERLYSDYVYFLKRNPKYISMEHFHRRAEESVNWWNQCISKFPIPKCLFGSPKGFTPVHTGMCFECWQASHICPNIRIGLYYYILQEWLKIFPRESFLFLRMEDYTGNELEVLNEQVFPFLGLLPLGEAAGEIVEKMKIQFPANNENVRDMYHVSPMLNKTRELLTTFYRESNIKLANFMNNNGYLWNS